MTFQIHALPAENFAPLFDLSNDRLSRHGARRVIADTSPGFPCRVSLDDAQPGETLILLNFRHQPALSPYRASHAIFVRQGAVQAAPARGEVPAALARRLLSIRAFDADHMMTQADVVQGTALAAQLTAMFDAPTTAYIHIHYARPGCFAASATRT